MLLSVIIVSYNTCDLTLATIDSVVSDLRATARLHEQTEIIVVDNASTDGSITALDKKSRALGKEHSPITLTLIKNNENLGFAKANNLGIAQATGRYVLLLNSDTLVQPRALENLLRTFAQADRLGILSPTLVNPDGSHQPQGGSFPSLLTLGAHMLMLDDLPFIGKFFPSTQHTGKRADQEQHTTQKLKYQDWIAGTAMLIKREVLDEIGGLDENIFMYGEDIEYCLRAAHHQWRVAIDPNACIIHLGSQSGSSERAIIGELQGYLYLWSKHQPHWQIPLVRVLLKLGILLRIIIFGTIVRDPTRARAYRRARTLL